MDNTKQLKSINLKIENLSKEKLDVEKELEQLRNQEKKIQQVLNQEERKKRNHRLIVRGAMLESYIEGAEHKTNEEIQEILGKVFLNVS